MVCWSALRICTLALAIDVCLQDGQVLHAKELFLQAQHAAAEKLQGLHTETTGAAGMEVEVEKSAEKSVEKTVKSDADDPKLDTLDAPDQEDQEEIPQLPMADEAALRTDGLPSWLSPREGHLIALLACHVSWHMPCLGRTFLASHMVSPKWLFEWENTMINAGI